MKKIARDIKTEILAPMTGNQTNEFMSNRLILFHLRLTSTGIFKRYELVFRNPRPPSRLLQTPVEDKADWALHQRKPCEDQVVPHKPRGLQEHNHYECR